MAPVRPLPPLSPPCSPSLASEALRGEHRSTVSRKLSFNELSYFLPSRADGVNDMYLHLGFRAPNAVLHPSRIHAVWAIQRLRHPLLAASVAFELDASSPQFEYTRPETVDEAIHAAKGECSIQIASKDDLISTYLNGPRLLSSSRTSFLIVAQDPEDDDEYHLLLCAMHCIGDGMALHSCANEMLSLLGGVGDADHLFAIVARELEKRPNIPRSMEEGLPGLGGRWKNAVAMADDQLLAKNQIGGQAFPRTKGALRKTVVPTVSFDAERTSRILARCKSNGVSVSNAVFALCNIAWARMLLKGTVVTESGLKLPSLMYTALNTRPWLNDESKAESFFKLCIGYFNIKLPSFIPSDHKSVTQTFWYRARLAKSQSTKAVKSPFIVMRTQLTTRKRADQSIKWAKIDDAAAEGKTGLTTPAPSPQTEKAAMLPGDNTMTCRGLQVELPIPKPQISSTALMGLSLLGNLDGTYKHTSYGDIKLHTLTTGSRQRAGAMLLFSYTFVGRLWLCFGYDTHGFTKGVVEEFWKELLSGVDEFLGL